MDREGPAATRVLAVAGVGLVASYVLAVAIVHGARAPRPTSWFGTSTVAEVVGLVTGGALVVAAVHLLRTSRNASMAAACLVLAVAWLAPVLVGWSNGPSTVRAVAAVVAYLTVPALAHLLLVATRPSSRARSVAVGVCYVTIAGLALTVGLTRNPFLDPDCWSDCSDHVLLWAEPEVSALLVERLRQLVIVVAVAGAVLAVREVATTRSARRHPGALAVALAAASGLALEGLHGWRLLLDPAERFDSEADAVLFLLRAASLLAVAGSTWWLAEERRRAVQRTTRLVHDLAARPPSGRFEDTLRESLGDPTLEVRYWRRDTGQYVDASGRARDESTDAERAHARVVRGSEPVAVVSYDGSRLGLRTLEQELGAAARLAIDNERLRAEAGAHLAELLASRERIVAEADRHRRRVERDLHDGAQQHLLAVSFQLRLARATADGAPSPSLDAATLDAAIVDAAACLDELREFAHGVFPAVLDHAGLGEALWSLADRSPLAVHLEIDLEDVPRSAAAERTAYLLAKVVLDTASGDVTITASQRDGELLVVATGAGSGDLTHVSDRVGAAGGWLRHAGDRLEAAIPCE